jgi:hypothetical protein
MAVHTDTSKLLPYNSSGYPTIPGGEALYLTNELRKISSSLNKAVEIIKLLEARMNTNGLT